MDKHEPVKPAPIWVHSPGAGFHTPVLGSPTGKSIADFTQGFEAGAYALAEKLNTVIGDGGEEGMAQAIRIPVGAR